MALIKYNQTQTIIIIRNLITTICAVHNSLLFGYHMYHTPACGRQKTKSRLQFLSISTLGFLCLYTIFSCTFLWYQIQSPYACTWIVKAGTASYALSKVVVYLFIMERLFFIFQRTTYGFNKTQKIMARTMASIYVITSLFICMVFADEQYHSELVDCTAVIPFWLLAYGGGADVIASLILSITFSRKLLVINLTMVENSMCNVVDSSVRSRTETMESVYTKNTMHNNSNMDREVSKSKSVTAKRMKSIDNINEQDSTFKILKKSTLLTFIALLSTHISILISAFIGLSNPLSALDSVINGWCCMLMFARYHGIYITLCGKMEKCITVQCLSCYTCNYCCCELDVATKADNENDKHVQRELSVNSSKTKDIISSGTSIDNDNQTMEIVTLDDENNDEYVKGDITPLDINEPDFYHNRNQSTAL